MDQRRYIDFIKEKKRSKQKNGNIGRFCEEALQEEHKQKAADVKRATRRDKRRYCQLKAGEAEEAVARRDQRSLFKLAKEIDGVQKVSIAVLKDVNGNKLTTEEQKKERRKQHFDSGLNCDEPQLLNEWDIFEMVESLIDSSSFSLEEIQDARKLLKSSKCPGQDPTASEMVIVLEENGIIALQRLYN